MDNLLWVFAHGHWLCYFTIFQTVTFQRAFETFKEDKEKEADFDHSFCAHITLLLQPRPELSTRAGSIC